MKLNYRLSLTVINLCEYTMLLSAIGSTIFFFWIDVPGLTWSYWVFQGLSIVVAIGYLYVAQYDANRILQFFDFREESINVSTALFRCPTRSSRLST